MALNGVIAALKQRKKRRNERIRTEKLVFFSSATLEYGLARALIL